MAYKISFCTKVGKIISIFLPLIYIASCACSFLPQPLQDTYAKQGEPVILEVTVEGHPEPIIKWYREDVEIYSSPDYQLSRSNKTYRLAILEVFPEDAGQFKVVAANAEGSVATEARLLVEREYKKEGFSPTEHG